MSLKPSIGSVLKKYLWSVLGYDSTFLKSTHYKELLTFNLSRVTFNNFKFLIKFIKSSSLRVNHPLEIIKYSFFVFLKKPKPTYSYYMDKIVAQRTGLSGDSFQLIMSFWIPFKICKAYNTSWYRTIVIVRHLNIRVQNGELIAYQLVWKVFQGWEVKLKE